MPRLFTGLEIPHDIADDLAFMRGGIAGATWIDRASFHITLRFIGDTALPHAREIAYELGHISAKAFDVRLQGIDVLGGNKPHTLYAGLADSPELRRLQAMHERIVQSLGLPAEPRRFVPHVTLARLKNPDLSSLQRYILGHNPYRSVSFRVSRFVLFSSRPSRGGGPYAVEAGYDLDSGSPMIALPISNSAPGQLEINQKRNIP